jgi:hypothetical protein
MEADRLAWLTQLTEACDHALAGLNGHDSPNVVALRQEIEQLRGRLLADSTGATPSAC